MKKNFLILLLIVAVVFVYFRQEKKNYYDMINAVSGATPLAIAREVPEGITLTVDGLVKQTYAFSASALNGFAATRIRTKEFTPRGDFLGAYAYVGVPVFNILEGIAPQKPDDAVFNQPLDILITFTAADGKSTAFTFNELIMADDCLPVTLAHHREPIKPTTDEVKDTYDKNRYTQPLAGLRLIAPREPDVTRYLDNVVRITYSVLPAPDHLLPKRRKGITCISEAITCVDGQGPYPGTFDGVKRISISDWAVVGHGHGFEEIVDAEGYELRSFLTANFDAIEPDDYFLFVACDGYRALYSRREIFVMDSGREMMIIDRMNGKWPVTGLRLAPTADFFADRSMWAVAYVVRLKN